MRAKTRRIEQHLVFRGAPPSTSTCATPGHGGEDGSRLEERQIAQGNEVPGFRSQRQSDDREHRRIHPPHVKTGAAGQVGGSAINRRSTCNCAATMSLPHAKFRDIDGSARARRAQVRHAGNLTQRLLERACRLHRHAIDGPVTGIRSHHDAGKSMVGNRATGRANAATRPPSAAIVSRKSTDRRCAASQAVVAPADSH